MDTGLGLMGFAALNPSYVLHRYCPLRGWVPSLSKALELSAGLLYWRLVTSVGR